MLEVRGVSKVFAGFEALRDVSIDVEPGQVRGLIGANGAGKSTLLQTIYGRITPTRGEIRFLGEDVGQLQGYMRARRGMALKFQTTSVFDDLTVDENLLLAARPKVLRRRPPGDVQVRIDQALEQTGLELKRARLAAELSHGERQWLEIAMVLLMEPRLLLLDEPTSGMTVGETKRTAALIKELQENRIIDGVLVVEHDISFIATISDLITVMHRGEVIADGTVDEIHSDKLVQDSYLGRLA